MATYDAFISYSHAADGRLAPRLQQCLQRFAKPMWRLRSLRIFRDETSLAATHALPDTLKRALQGSRYFILLASPAAAQSKWVAQETQHWLAIKGSTSLLVVLTEGEIVWSDAKGDFDWTRTTALPKCLAGAFNSEPKWEDVTKIRQADDISPRNPVLQHATASLFCVIKGRALDDVIGEDIRVHRRNAQILYFGAAAIFLTLCGFMYQLLATRAEQRRFETVFDLLAYHAEDKRIRSAFLLPDLSKVEDQTGLAIATIAAARRIARRDLKDVKVLWVDDHPKNNEQEINSIKDRLNRIGAKFELSTEVPDALERLQSGLFHLVITNYGDGRCGRDGKAIAECILEGVKTLSSRPPVIIYSSNVQPEIADQMKCKGAIADTQSPDVLFAWIVRALDAGFAFRPSPEIQRFCTEQREPLKPVNEVATPRPQPRQFWTAFRCNPDLMTVIDFGPERIRVASPTIDAWRTLATVLQAHGYQIRTGETSSYYCRTFAPTHSCGIAVDVNFNSNPKLTPNNRLVRFSDKPTQAERAQEVRLGIADTDMTPAMIADVSKIATKDGRRVFQWGGQWGAAKEPSHFEVVLAPQELEVGIDPATSRATSSPGATNP